MSELTTVAGLPIKRQAILTRSLIDRVCPLLQHQHNKGIQMKKPLFSQRQITHWVISFALLSLLGFGLYAGLSADQQSSATLEASRANVANKAAAAQPTATFAGGSLLMQSQSTKTTAQSSVIFDAKNVVRQTSAQHNIAANLAAGAMSQEQMAKLEMPADFIPANADGQTDAAPFSRIHLAQFSAGSKAIALLGSDLNAVAQWYGMSSDGFRGLLLNDGTVYLDRKGRVVHIDAGLPAGAAGGGSMQASSTSTGAASAALSPYPLDQTFLLHTKPGSTRILYLNFIGDGKNPAFSLDNMPSTFSDAERTLIQKAWQRVSEDYAPFDVDITTEKPVSSAGKIGASILISPQANSAGGYAYLNSFMGLGAGAPPAFCFPNNLANSEKPIAECISHELGHTLGLTHQGALPSTPYYTGHGSGETGWAPIMGVSYYKNLTQWAKGEFANANNKTDAYAIMSRQGLNPEPDDHGNSIALADAMRSESANGYYNHSAQGVIETPGDVDVMRFYAGAGNASFSVSGAAFGGNLDVSVQLLDSQGKVLASSNSADTLAKTISAILPLQGTYFLSVSGAGRGNPLTTGYSNYGSLGKYSIKGTTALSTGTPPPASSTPPAAPNVPVVPPATVTPAISVAVRLDAGMVTPQRSVIKSYLWNFGDGSPNADTKVVTHIYTQKGTYNITLVMVDSFNRTMQARMQLLIK
jgi:hypothetical protein